MMNIIPEKLMKDHGQAMLEEIKKSFNTIAEVFSHTRENPWPEFGIFKHYIPDGVSILDVGCGNGRFLQYLNDKKKAVDYTGMDFSKKLIDIARKRFPQAEFLEQDMTDFHIPGRFDRIIAIASFHHIPTRKLRKKTLQLFFDHLKDDGVFIISVWNLWRFKYRLPLLKGFLKSLLTLFSCDPRDVTIPFGQEKVPRYYHAFLRSELKSLLGHSHFVIEDEIKSRENFIFICRKNLVKGVQSPALELDQSSAFAS